MSGSFFHNIFSVFAKKDITSHRDIPVCELNNITNLDTEEILSEIAPKNDEQEINHAQNCSIINSFDDENINEEETFTEENEEERTLFDPTKELSHYKKPPVDLLDDHSNALNITTHKKEAASKNEIVHMLGYYNISFSDIKITIGTTITLYEITPTSNVRISKLKELESDILLNLGTRISLPTPKKNTIDIELPNQIAEIVSMYSVINSAEFKESTMSLPVVFGKTVKNEAFVLDIAQMPHCLIAGGSGQGVPDIINTILTSLLYKVHPSLLKLVLVDGKIIDFSTFNKIKNIFLAKLPDSQEAIITDTQKVLYTLQSLCREMDARYDLLKLAQVRNIKEYNQKFTERKLNPLKGHRYFPYIVLVINEYANFIMTVGREIETPLVHLLSLAHTIGIHIIIATENASTDIITDSIKTHIPIRIAVRVNTKRNSRAILNTEDALHLIGRGDMLVSSGSEMIRVQCAFVDTPEVERICDYIGQQQGYGEAFPLPEYKGEENDNGNRSVDLNKRDELFEEAARLIVQHQQGSTSLIQRKMNLGYNRAGRLMDQLEAAGIVGAFEGSKARRVLISDFTTLDQRLRDLSSN